MGNQNSLEQSSRRRWLPRQGSDKPPSLSSADGGDTVPTAEDYPEVKTSETTQRDGLTIDVETRDTDVIGAISPTVLRQIHAPCQKQQAERLQEMRRLAEQPYSRSTCKLVRKEVHGIIGGTKSLGLISVEALAMQLLNGLKRLMGELDDGGPRVDWTSLNEWISELEATISEGLAATAERLRACGIDPDVEVPPIENDVFVRW